MTQRLKWTRLLLCIGFAAGFLVTQPLWLSTRLYPLTPVFSWLPELSSPWDQWLYYALFPLLAAIVFCRKPIYGIVPFLCLMTYLLLADQSRWHPWVYWFTFMMLAMAYAYRDESNAARSHAALNACRVILIAAYLWAGLQKINVTFYFNLFPWVLSAFIPAPELHPFWSKVPFIIPIIEAFISLFLILPRYRMIGIVMALAMHSIILVFLGPLGHNVNTNIWAWNLSLFFLTPLLFLRTDDVSPRQLLYPSSALQTLVLMLFMIMPVFTFFNRWDAYPGFSLYSGSQRAAYIQMTDETTQYLPEPLQAIVDTQHALVASKWAMSMLNTPDYAEPRIYQNLLRYACHFIPEAQHADVHMIILSKPNRLTGKRDIDRELSCTKD